jgi:heme/copper-type cytochrome/quinol oxidase subunit 3
MSIETHAHTNSHHEHPDVVGSRNRLGLILLLVADISFALAVLFVYFYLKGQNVNDMWLPKASTANDAQHAATVPVSSMGAWYVTLIAAFGLVFQRYASFTITMGAYASCYYLIAGLNMVHLFLTVFISLGNWNRSRLGIYAGDHWHVEIVKVWWIWMTVSSLLGTMALSFT